MNVGDKLMAAGRRLAERVEASVQACERRDADDEECDETCECCGEDQLAIYEWMVAVWDARQAADEEASRG